MDDRSLRADLLSQTKRICSAYFNALAAGNTLLRVYLRNEIAPDHIRSSDICGRAYCHAALRIAVADRECDAALQCCDLMNAAEILTSLFSGSSSGSNSNSKKTDDIVSSLLGAFMNSKK